MIRPWFILGAVLAVFVLVVGCYLKGHHDGSLSARSKMQAEIEKQAARVKALEKQASDTTQETAQAIEVQRNERSEEFARARIVIQPVRLCPSAPSRIEVPAVPAGPATADGTAPGSESPVRTGRDIGPALAVLAHECQRDADDALKWREWYEHVKPIFE